MTTLRNATLHSKAGLLAKGGQKDVCHDAINHIRGNARRRTRIALEPVRSTCGAEAEVEAQGRELPCKIAKSQISVVWLQMGNEDSGAA